VLMAVSAVDGAPLAEDPLDATPVFDGMAAAEGRLDISLENGRLVCLSAPAERWRPAKPVSAAQDSPARQKTTGSPGSRAWDVHACSGSQTPPRPPTPRHVTARAVLRSPCQDKIGTRK